MSIFIDRKYLGLIQYRLDRFSQKKMDLYNFRCPYCHDSKKSKIKARGYIYRKSNDYFYRCHNCNYGTTFGHFIKDIDPNTYRQYVLERYASGDNAHMNVEKPKFDDLKGNAFEKFQGVTKRLMLSVKNIAELPDGHYAKTYIQDRSIPHNRWTELYYTDHFKDFLDQDFPNHGKEDVPNDDRIIFLYTNEVGEISHVSGRALRDTKVRYITVKVSDDKKIYGLLKFDPTRPAFVVEGQFDSFFLDNCVATGDSNLATVVGFFPNTEWTLVFDNEPRNREIVRVMGRAIDNGHKVCIFPEDIVQKDINDMVLAGIDVNKLVAENTHQGATALMKFIGWKRA